MKDKPTTTTTTATPPAPAPAAVYEVTIDGPIKVGGVIASRGARLYLTPDRAAALLAAIPGCIRPLGIS